MKKTTAQPITFFIELIEYFNYKRLSLGCLYELKSMHAVVDFVEIFKAIMKITWFLYNRLCKLIEAIKIVRNI